jgi:hypothetical protein
MDLTGFHSNAKERIHALPSTPRRFHCHRKPFKKTDIGLALDR